MPLTAQRATMGELLSAETMLRGKPLKLEVRYRKPAGKAITELRLLEADEVVLSYKISSNVRDGIALGIVEHHLSGDGADYRVRVDASGRRRETGSVTLLDRGITVAEGQFNIRTRKVRGLPPGSGIAHAITTTQLARLKPFEDLLRNEIDLLGGLDGAPAAVRRLSSGGGVNPDECTAGCQLARIACTMACCGIVGGETLGLGCILCWAGCRIALRRCDAGCRRGSGGGGGVVIQ